jgi:hypothetical protein
MNDQTSQNSRIFSEIKAYQLVFLRIIPMEFGVDFSRRKK